MKRSQAVPEAALGAWLQRIGASGDRPDQRLAEAAADLVETMVERPQGLSGALYRFGNTLGSDGWPMAQASEWLYQLALQLDRPHRKQLAHYTAHTSLAQGWADGYVRGAHSGMCIDPTTGLVTVMVLRLRLREIYEHSRATGVPTPELYTVLIVDVDTADLPRLEADLLMVCVAELVHEVFQQGETIARAGDRIMVLAGRTDDTEERAEILGDRLRLDHSTRRAHPMVLQAPPPSEHIELDRYMRDLVG